MVSVSSSQPCRAGGGGLERGKQCRRQYQVASTMPSQHIAAHHLVRLDAREVQNVGNQGEQRLAGAADGVHCGSRKRWQTV